MHKIIYILLLLPVFSASAEEILLMKSTLSNGAQIFQLSNNQISSHSVGQTLVGKVSSANSEDCVLGFWKFTYHTKLFSTIPTIETKKTNCVITNLGNQNARLFFLQLKPKECTSFKFFDYKGAEIDKTRYTYSFEGEYSVNIQVHNIPSGIYSFVLSDSKISETCILIVNK